jgi:hypothetical protein
MNGCSFQSSSSGAALPALLPALERGHLNVVAVGRHINQRLVPARVVVSAGDRVLHAKPSHVAQRHRRAGFVALFHHSMILTAAGAFGHDALKPQCARRRLGA